MTATDEQIARVKDYMLHGCLNDEYSEALAAVLSELTELRRKVTDQANSLRHAAEEVEGLRELRDAVQAYGRSGDGNEQAATFDAMFVALAKCQK